MGFKNLPIEFDENGKAYLKEGVRDPYAYQTRSLHEQADRIQELLARNGHIKSVDFDPVTRVAGALAFHSVVDLKERKVVETNSMATLFRGYEVILKGRDPRDAAFISSRACGVCGGVHSTTSALAMEMAFPVTPPPLGGVDDPTKAEANLMPVGTGPFVFDSYTAGVEIRLKRNAHYFKDGLPRLDEVVFRIIPEASTQIQALEAGEVDYAWRLPGPDTPRIAESPDTDVIPVALGPGGGFCIMTMTFNLERDVFNDVRVRQAFAHAIDRQQIVDQIIFGQGRVAEAPISSAITWAHLEGGPRYDYDPAQAEALLDEAGFPKGADGLRFAVDFVHFPTFAKYGEVLREQLSKVGIDFKLRPLERDAAVDVIFNQRDFDTNVISSCNNTDPEIGVRRMYVSSNIGNIPFSNGAACKNPEVDALFDQAASTADVEVRGELYHRIQEILLRDLPYWWLVETDFSVGVRSNCHDVQAWSGHFAETAWCENQ